MILKFKNFKGRITPFVLFLLIAAGVAAAAGQEFSGIPNNIPRYNPGPNPTPTPAKKNPPVVAPLPNNLPVVSPTPPVVKNKEKYKPVKPKRQILNEEETPAEKSMAVGQNVVVNLCVSEGKVRINGWDRSEIRAYVGGGSQIGFQIQQKDKSTGKPVLMKILGFDPSKYTDADAEECLAGDEIEIDVPRGASVNIKGAESQTSIESVRKVSVDNVGGDIFLSDIKQGIHAKTYRGGITVGQSGGQIHLDSANGNIVAYEISPNEIGDFFKAKTINGMITLQQIEHILTEISTNSGHIRFNSEFLSGGQYVFSTINGSILLTIPETSSCRITASYGGLFGSEIPLKNQKLSSSGGIKNLTGQLGDGGAMLSLTTYNGRINIRKQ